MKKLTGTEIRRKFLDFFKEKGHLELPSASLIPQDDPTLLLIGAGMAPFKPFFTGKMRPPKNRIVTCQKCIRTGDIENVGRTARHHTFFEMLGNFSFGDYFKKEVIPWSWEFLTKELEIPKELLWVTIHPDDQEAFDLWHDVVGLSEERIVRLEENFWEIGSGPCGPDSEIFVDLGAERGCGKATCKVGCDCDRFLEIWNLVFTQYNQNEDGTYTPLEKKNIDTGAGLERIASVIQGKESNFETDLIFPIIEYTANIAKIKFGENEKKDISLKVIADHVRSFTMMINDGILPANDGRGYILRRVLRRAVRHGRLLGINKQFLNGIVDVVINLMGEHYTSLHEKEDYIQKVVEMEEKRFMQTLQQGTEILNEKIEILNEKNEKILDGSTVFKLYDTFGFPWELTEEIIGEHGLEMDKAGFDLEMEKQRERARSARSDKEGRPVIYDTSSLDVENLIVDEKVSQGKIVAIYNATEPQLIFNAVDGNDIAVICDETAFHAEGGGQLGDVGMMYGETSVINIKLTKKLPDGSTIHIGTILEGSIGIGDKVKFEINKTRKNDIARNHTATHLLHAALKKVLGEHVNQAGSYVGPDRLRFDFSHFSAVTNEELTEVEKIVNEKVLEAIELNIQERPIAEAKKLGAMALFGEKYGDVVRVVTVPGYSVELCGGTHVHNTAELGTFKILSESSTGAGVRRIEAVTGHGALNHINSNEILLKNISNELKCRPIDIVEKLDALHFELKKSENKVSELADIIAASQTDNIENEVQNINGLNVLAKAMDVDDVEALRNMGDKLREKIDGVVVLVSKVGDGKVSIIAMATKESVKKGIHCGNIIKEVAKVVGGGGGGRPDMAQAGGRDTSKIAEAIENAWDVVRNQIK